MSAGAQRLIELVHQLADVGGLSERGCIRVPLHLGGQVQCWQHAVQDLQDRAAPSARIDDLAASLFGEQKPERRQTNFQVTHARQGEEGFQLVLKSLRERRSYALAFVDARMPPGWDGLQTIEQIWGHDTEIEIVLCTAHADYSWEDIATRLPHAERLLILRKPFDPLEVRQLAYGLAAKWFLRRQATCRMLDLKRMVVQRMRDIELLRSRIAELGKQRQAQPAPSGHPPGSKRSLLRGP